MAFPNATNLQIDRSTFNDAQGDINYHIQTNHNHHVDEGQDTRSRVHSSMKDHIHTDAFHDSGARRDPSRCYPGTREAALKTISDWATNSTSHCLWLHGPAGTGKTAIAQTFAEQCQRDGILGATYFFTRSSTGGPLRGPPPLFSTLAYQLMSVFHGLDEQIRAAICADRTIFERSLSTQLDRLIVQPFLRLTINKFPSAVVIIDGLDECDGDSIQGEIVRLILDLERHSLPLLFLVSSRPEPVIRYAFRSSPRSSLACLLLDKALHPDHDIRHFLRKEFERIYAEMGMSPLSQSPWPSTEAIEELVHKSSGHFIYAATVIRFVQEDHAHPMDRLDAILKIPSESTSSSATKGVIAASAAFQELDGLYLHILRKYRNQVELAKILRAIMHFSSRMRHPAPSDLLELVFGLRHGGLRIMLRGMHSIIDSHAGVRFLHASFSDFLADPERSHEFYFSPGRLNAEIACGYIRLIVAFPPGTSEHRLEMAMDELEGCLEATRADAGLLPATLGRLIPIITQESLESTPPCRSYLILDFLSRKILEKFPEAVAERRHCETILQRLRPQLVELSDRIITILRVLGVYFAARVNFSAFSFYLDDAGRLIGVPNGREIFQETLRFDHKDFYVELELKSFRRIQESLFHWLLAHHPPKPMDAWRPAHVVIHQYTWAWAWDNYASPNSNGNFVHYVDLNYGCLRTLILEFSQPSENPIPPLTQATLEHASKSICNTGLSGPYFDLIGVIEGIDFTCILRALPDLSTVPCPRLFYLHHGLDWLYYCLRADGHFPDPPLPCFHRLIPHYQTFLETIYSRLLEDPLASRIIPVIYAMFRSLWSNQIAQFLDFVPGELNRSAVMQSLFGVGIGEDKDLEVSNSLGVLLKMGQVKLRPSQDDEDKHIDDHIRDAHEYLAFSCAKHLASRTGPVITSLDSYVEQYWSEHLKRAKPSERLFEMLRWVNITGRDVGPVIRWLEEHPDVPEDILARWCIAWADHDIMSDPPSQAQARIDRVLEGRRSFRLKLQNRWQSSFETHVERGNTRYPIYVYKGNGVVNGRYSHLPLPC